MRCGRCGLVEVLVRYCDGWWGVLRLWRAVLKVCVCVGRVVGVGVGVGCLFVGVGSNFPCCTCKVTLYPVHHIALLFIEH